MSGNATLTRAETFKPGNIQTTGRRKHIATLIFSCHVVALYDSTLLIKTKAYVEKVKVDPFYLMYRSCSQPQPLSPTLIPLTRH
jgi:hypothetical protein